MVHASPCSRLADWAQVPNDAAVLKRLFASFSLFGLLVGLLFLCGSLTPSLLPRVPAVQGVLSGFAFATGYGLGVALLWVWRALGFTDIAGRIRDVALWAMCLALLALTVFTFGRNTVWQNSIRERMDMPSVEGSYPWLIALLAVVLAVVLILLGRAVLWLAMLASRRLERLLPQRAAIALGALVAIFVTVEFANGFLFQGALRAADEVFAASDRVINEGVDAPDHPYASGGPNSVIAWEDIGRNGKDFLTRGPSERDIEAFTGDRAMEPIRVYAGFDSGETFEERAAMALQDLIALGGFERSVLVIATPTGTGWLDPAAIQTVPYVFGGDIALVSAQYTYVPSWMSLLVEPDRSRRAAKALFDAVYDHWADLPADQRPKLYLFGLSLGALGSEASADLVTIFGEPIDGALWSGPPFASRIWAQVVAARNEGSPYRLPEFRDGRLVRFMNQDGIAAPVGAEWGAMRLLYLQYGSDPMTFFSSSLLFSRPDWLRGGDQRARDVSPFFNWYPVVTFLQVAFDIPMATSTPSGYGHTYNARHYIDGWLAVTDPPDWTSADTIRLKALFDGFEVSPI